jgi:hypothetical protein
LATPLAVIEPGHYIPRHRRPTRLGLAVVALLLVLLGAYTAYWLIGATRICDGITAWAQTERAKKVDIPWQMWCYGFATFLAGGARSPGDA